MRGIIEYIAEQPDYDGTVSPDEKVPSTRKGVQPRIDWIIDYSPAYAIIRERIITRRQIRRVDFDRASRNIYHELSKYFHENRIAGDKNADRIIVDMTQDFKKGVFGIAEGGVLESLLHYRHIPYTTIRDDTVEQFAPSKPWGNLEGTVMPPTYRQELYETLLEGPMDLVTVDGDTEKVTGVVKTVSTSPA